MPATERLPPATACKLFGEPPYLITDWRSAGLLHHPDALDEDGLVSVALVHHVARVLALRKMAIVTSTASAAAATRPW